MTSRLVPLLTTLMLAIGLAACASGRAPLPTYGDELARLSSDCAERGGILAPAGSGMTGRPQTDYVCRISGGASRIN